MSTSDRQPRSAYWDPTSLPNHGHLRRAENPDGVLQNPRHLPTTAALFDFDPYVSPGAGVERLARAIAELGEGPVHLARTQMKCDEKTDIAEQLGLFDPAPFIASGADIVNIARAIAEVGEWLVHLAHAALDHQAA
jgi:hypothetical protein